MVDVTAGPVDGVGTEDDDEDVVAGEDVVGAVEVRTEDVTAAGWDDVVDTAAAVVTEAVVGAAMAVEDVDLAGAESLLQLAASRRSAPTAVPPRLLTMRRVIRRVLQV